MSARRSLSIVVVIGAIVAVAIWTYLRRASPSQADLRPIPGQNILLITIDTLRADALGSYGGAAATPALDRLAADGVRFDFAHAHAVLTLTSHASILTGELPFTHGLPRAQLDDEPLEQDPRVAGGSLQILIGSEHR